MQRSPTLVNEPPPAVPGFIVTPSRMVQCDPISSRVTSPLNFRSCGSCPSEANGNTRVCARCWYARPPRHGFSARRRPQHHIGPDDTKRPDRHIRAKARGGVNNSGGMNAHEIRRSLAQCQPAYIIPPPATLTGASSGGSYSITIMAPSSASATSCPSTFGFTLEPPHVPAAIQPGHVILQPIAGHDRLAELALVHGHEIHDLGLATGLTEARRPHRGLGHALDDQHTRHDRPGPENVRGNAAH